MAELLGWLSCALLLSFDVWMVTRSGAAHLNWTTIGLLLGWTSVVIIVAAIPSGPAEGPTETAAGLGIATCAIGLQAAATTTHPPALGLLAWRAQVLVWSARVTFSSGRALTVVALSVPTVVSLSEPRPADYAVEWLLAVVVVGAASVPLGMLLAVLTPATASERRARAVIVAVHGAAGTCAAAAWLAAVT